MTPTWSPTGTQIAFTSDRTRPSADLDRERSTAPACDRITGESYCDRADLVARAVQRDRLRVAGRRRLRHQDLRLRARARRATITDGNGSNESPAFSPNGRHIAFMSTRAGKRADLHDRPRRQRICGRSPSSRAAIGIRIGRSRPGSIEVHEVQRVHEVHGRRTRVSSEDKMQIGRVATSVVILTLAVTFGACAKRSRRSPGRFPPPPADPATPAGLPPEPPEPVPEPVGVPPEPRIRTIRSK